jgi:uncharacterized membrane protein YdjX (TVP38/TMEM64 family)
VYDALVARRRAAPILAIALAVVAVAFALRALPAARLALGHMAHWLRGAGALGVAVYVAVFVAANVVLIPGAWFAAAAGFVYGPIRGGLLALPTGLLGCCTTFVVGRYLARGWVARRTAASPRLAAVDEAVAQGGARVVLLLRLSLPHNVLNYALAASRVTPRDYITGSAAGLLPITFLFAYGGSLAADASNLADAGRARLGPWVWVLPSVALLAGVAVSVMLTRAARAALRRRRAHDAAGRDAQGGTRSAVAGDGRP